MTRLHRHPMLRRCVAVAMAVVFLQGFAGTFLHLDLEEHFYCVEHQRVTHGETHADNQGDPQAERSLAGSERNPADERDREGDPDHDGCEWMAWLHKNTQASPHLTPQLLDLPPPAVANAPSHVSNHQFFGHTVARRHISPANSPPRV